MKTIIFILAFLFSISLFSQTNVYNIIGHNSENNGVAPKDIFSECNIPFNNTPLTNYNYDSIRAITEINNPSNADAFPWISPDGLRLYYTSSADSNKLMFTERNNLNSYFSSPVIIPISISNPSSYWLSNNELDVYICNDSLFFAHRESTTLPFNIPVYINLIQPYSNVTYRDASLNNSQNTLYISAWNGSYLGIFEFSRISSTSFTYVNTLPIPLGYTSHSGQLSKDELTFFLDASYNLFNTKLYQLTRDFPTDPFTVETFQQIQNINDTLSHNVQPSMSDSLNWVAFVRNPHGFWAENDLFIAHKGGEITSVFDPIEDNIDISVYPNPTTSCFTIRFNKLIRSGVLSIYSIDGQNLKTINMISGEKITVQRDNLSSGIYFLRLLRDKQTIWVGKLIILDH